MLSILRTRIRWQTPTYENPAGTDRAVIPRRRVQPKVELTPKETQSKRNAQAKDTTGHNKDKARFPPPSFTDPEACRILDAANAKQKNLSQSIACRRQNLDKDRNVKECLGNRLSLECPHAPTIQQMMTLLLIHLLQTSRWWTCAVTLAWLPKSRTIKDFSVLAVADINSQYKYEAIEVLTI